MNEYIFEDCYIGKKEEFKVSVEKKHVESFGKGTGDLNPLHTKEDYAINKGFKGKVVYGMLTASFLSTLAGMYLPGKFSLIQEVNIKFVKPVYVGDELVVSGEVIERSELFQQLVLKVVITNQNKEAVIRGKMKIGVLDGERK